MDEVREVLDRRRGRTTSRAFLKDTGRWQVSFHERGGEQREIAQVYVSDRTGEVLEAWTGFQVAWTMARGYPGAFGRRATSRWVWLGLCVLFVAPFVRPRRPGSLLHLDLLVLVGLSVSLAFFSHGKIGLSVPLAYPVLLYLLGRMLWIGVRGPPGAPLRLLVPGLWLGVGILFLVGFRVALNVANSNVIDVGYSGTIGADRILAGEDLYGTFPRDNEHGDTYGPVAYLAYVPWLAVLGWDGKWDDLPVAHAAAITFDLLTLLALYVLGRRLRGPTLGLALAWAWVAYPFTLFASNTNSNDSLVALLVVLAQLAAASPPARGVAVGLASAAKLGPLGLAPLFLRGREEGWRSAVAYAAAVVGVCAAALGLAVALGSAPGEVWDRTVGFQADRDSPFSIWGLWGWSGPQRVVQVTAVGLCLALAVVPRRPTGDPARLAALAAAALIALQLGVDHWFYLYVVWFFPLVMVALLARGAARSTAPGAAVPAPSG